MAVRKLVSENVVPAIVNSKANGHFVMLDSELNGGGKEAVAIDDEGGLFLRNVKTTGYAAAVRHKGETLPSKTLEEYVSGEPVVPHTSPKKTLNLRMSNPGGEKALRLGIRRASRENSQSDEI